MPVGATIGASALSGAASIGSGIIQSGAAGKAADAAREAQQQTLNYTKGVYNDAGANLKPFIEQGQTAGTALGGLLGLNGDAAAKTAFDKYLGSTNYNFRLDQGEKAITTANAPAFVSGATSKALNDYAQGTAGDALAGYEGILQGQQQLGAGAAANLGGIGMQGGQIINSANQASAGSQAQALGYGATAQTNALSGINQAIKGAVTGSSFAQPGGGSSGTSMTLANAPKNVQDAFAGLL